MHSYQLSEGTANAQLKMAIDNALLPAQQSHLLASYLQVLIMSEGDAWVHRAAHDVGLLMRSDKSQPAAEAEDRVRRFSTRELRGVPGGVNEVEEYIANAAVDLVILAAWGVAAGQIGAEQLPVSPPSLLPFLLPQLLTFPRPAFPPPSFA